MKLCCEFPSVNIKTKICMYQERHLDNFKGDFLNYLLILLHPQYIV